MLAIVRPWDRQPSIGGARLNKAHPLAPYVRGLFLPAGGVFYDAVSGKISSLTGAVTTEINANGAGIYTSSKYATFPGGTFSALKELTLVAVFRWAGVSGGNQNPISNHTSWMGYCLEIDTSGVCKLVVGNGGSWQVLSIGTLTAGRSVVAASASSASGQLLGKINAGTVVSGALSGSTATTTLELGVGGAPAYGNNFNGALNLAAVLSTACPREWLTRLAANPWQLFEWRIWVPVGAAIGGLPTLAAITASAITTSGATLTITA